MRHALVRLAALLITLMLVLTGCNLIGIDPIMQLDEDFAALHKKYSGVVATYDGGEITQESVMTSFMSEYSYMYQLYSMYGFNMSEDVVKDLEKSTVEDAVRAVAVAKQIEQRGLKLDDEKLAEIQKEADEHYQEAYDAFYQSAEGKDEKVRAKQTEYNMAVNGYTREGLYNMELASANSDLLEQAVRDEITEVSDDEVRAAYDAQVKEDEEAYAASHGGFESTMASDSEIVCWIPEGYRTVKHILVKPEDSLLSAVTDARNAYDEAQEHLEEHRKELADLNDAEPAEEAEPAENAGATEGEESAENAGATEGEESAENAGAEKSAEAGDQEPAEEKRTAEEIQADIDSIEAELETLKAAVDKAEADCLASVQDKLDEIYARIDAGEDFAALIETYGEDPGMKNEPTKTRGYYVCADSENWDKYFTAGAMALEKVGDVSATPVISTSGVHIIRYESDATPGAVPFEDIKDALYEKKLDEKKNEHYTSELESWIAALNPQYNISAFNLSSDED